MALTAGQRAQVNAAVGDIFANLTTTTIVDFLLLTKAAQLAAVTARLNARKALLQTQLANVAVEKAAEETSLTAQIADIDGALLSL